MEWCLTRNYYSAFVTVQKQTSKLTYKTLISGGFRTLFPNMIDVIIALDKNFYMAKVTSFQLGKLAEESYCNPL